MPLAPGTKVGPYEIVALIGAGGMGEVSRARDTRLGRDVALKILPESFARESDRLIRFEQEACSVAALNHPNILAVFDIGQHNGSPFLVSELLEGETLRALLDRGALPQRKAIDYGVQIAQGLAAAHEKGIVHRDLKPENIFLTKDGRIKILDFGLAKLAQKPGAERDAPDEITLTSSHTAAGVVMGTASYMAPEQVRGDAVDARTDIFAFGAVLYEVLSGKRAFRRDTAPETMTAVLKEDPPELTDAAHPVSPALDRIVRRCLEKNPEQRFQSAKDLSFALASLSGTDSSAAAKAVGAVPRRASNVIWKSAAIALAIVAAVAGVAWFLATRSAPKARMQFAIPVTAEVSHMALSRDGSMLAFVSPDEGTGLPVLYVQRIGAPGATRLPGTEGATYPFWSPDGANVAFFSNGKLQRVPASGGPPQKLVDVLAARGGSWGSRNVIIYAPDAGSSIWRVNPDGTGAAAVTDVRTGGRLDETHRWPFFLPDGNHFLYWDGNFGNDKDDRASGLYCSSLDRKERKLVILAHSNGGVALGRLFYANDEHQLVSVPFDISKGTVSGNPSSAATLVGFQPATYWADFSVAETGTLVYNVKSGSSLSELVWADRSGKRIGTLGQQGVMCNPSISPDGNRVSTDITDTKANNVDIWLFNTRGGGNTRFTFAPEEEVDGVWSRDGKLIAYRSNMGAGAGVLVKPADGLGEPRILAQVKGTDDMIPNSWTLDGKKILCTHFTTSGYVLELVPLDGGPAARFHAGSSSEATGMISPDGKWVAYASADSGNWEIYVSTFPGAEGKWQVSRGGGTQPRWRGDGKEIFYEGPTGMLTGVPVSTEPGFSTGTPVPMFQIQGRFQISSTDIFTYDVTKDGQRFLINRYVKPEYVAPITIVLNAASPDQ
ncbi:MAG: protein kinase domain-containing protein [Candidatus Acidiferrales bacterium]